MEGANHETLGRGWQFHYILNDGRCFFMETLLRIAGLEQWRLWQYDKRIDNQ